MSTVLLLAGILTGIVLFVLRGLAMDEVRGRIGRRVAARVEETIASMPPELQAEWGDEWRAELASLKWMPFSSLAFARNLRVTAMQLVASSELAPARVGPPGRAGSRLQGNRRRAMIEWLGAFIAGLWSRLVDLPRPTLSQLGAVLTLLVQLLMAGAILYVTRSIPQLVRLSMGGATMVWVAAEYLRRRR